MASLVLDGACEHFLRLNGERRVDHDLVLRRDHLVDRGEVATPAVERITDNAKQHPESCANEHRGTNVEDGILRRRKYEQQETKEQPEPRAARCTREGCAAVGHLAGDAFDRAQITPNDGDLFHRKLSLGQPINDRLRLVVGVVGAEHIPFGERGEPYLTT